MTIRLAVDPVAEFKRSWPLDLIAPLDDETRRRAGALSELWAELAVADLPHAVQYVALRDSSNWRNLVEAVLAPAGLDAACDMFVKRIEVELVHRYGKRRANISLARAGLLTDEIPTLEALGVIWRLTRERVRQLARGIADEALAALDRRAPLRLAITAQYAIRPRAPIAVEMFADPTTARGRAVRLAIQLLSVPTTGAGDLWTETREEAYAVELLVAALPRLVPGATSVSEMKTRAIAALPGIDEALDVDLTLRFLAERLDFGPGVDGRIAFGQAALESRIARKIVTYLQRRAAPITPVDLARAIQKGVPPFEPFHRALAQPEWVLRCARRNPDLLVVQADGSIGLARQLSHLRPTGTGAILHSIVVDYGQPIRMIDLCDRAAEFGIGRNQVGMLIHSGRAASLFMLDRGIVGLVGRDEGADPSEYEAARPGATPRPSVGQEIGFTNGCIAVNIEVRRSIREQGLAVPWPLSIVYFDDAATMHVDGSRRPIVLRANGYLDLPDLEPGSHIQLRLTVSGSGLLLDIDHDTSRPIRPVMAGGRGSMHAVGLPVVDGRPGWIRLALARAATEARPLEELIRLMPSRMTERRRTRALYGLVALGLIRRRGSGWMADADRQLPRKLSAAMAAVTEDPSSYGALPRELQAAIVWLVWATWLVPSLGWLRVRPNDLGDAGAEVDGVLPSVSALTGPRETALMRIVEAAHEANDLRRHPGAEGGVDATARVVRRYLTALGYTAYNAVRTLRLGNELTALSVHPAADLPASAIWLLRPIGAGLADADIEQATRLAEHEGVAVVVATDGLEVVASGSGKIVIINLMAIGREPHQFDRLASLALDPSVLSQTNELPLEEVEEFGSLH